MAPSMFARQSSEIDWCEANYLHSEYIAEYYNTVSNVVFFLVGPLMMYLLHPYARSRSLVVHLVWLMFIVVGLFSTYYHMTLSYFGQLLDELSILWVIAIGYSVWFPRPYFPVFIKDRNQFGAAIFFVAAICTGMSFVMPTINAYALNCISFHILYIVVKEIRKCENKDIHHLALLSFSLWFVAITCWLSDRLFCGFWKRINFCYLHSIWHIMICVTVVYSNTLFSYFDAQYEIPECHPQVRYWPLKSLRIGIPYLDITKNNVPKKRC
ncbi:alkaline ceramidase 1 [Bombina bombina]|uniref:alkaline ceramidase 1 n=1 Tax=Bombina bombina TaxID=8345 RepID=UPI00235A62D9|nr:alkaline ceramidase 1 [Bombina bombina]